jgi:hypothetical protein
MKITFTQSSTSVSVYDFIEIAVQIEDGIIANPFTDANLFGLFGADGKSETGAPHGSPVDGFCDDPAGKTYRIRYMPTTAGKHTFAITFRHGAQSWQHNGEFEAVPGGRRGLLHLDRSHPWHFVWGGTGEHYYYNSTTTYFLLGLRDEAAIRGVVDRMHRLKVNRLRVALNPARVKDGMAWGEPVYPSEEFTFLFGPWVAQTPEDLEKPQWDVTRFDVAFWQKYERMLAYACSRDILISVIFYVDGLRPGVDPFGRAGDPSGRPQLMGGEDEQRYYHYAAARLSAFSNVMWDVSNEYQLFRTAGWAERMGAFLKSCDPYGHLTSIHGHATFEFRNSGWADFAMYQTWDEHGGYDFMLNHRLKQAEAGRPMPQVNEEYGYEDHYPQYGGIDHQAPARSSDSRCRLAWEMVMAGGYQTTGEYAGDGQGGWINGRGSRDGMLIGNSFLMDFITSFNWWEAEPRPDLAGEGTLCLRVSSSLLALYAPQGGNLGVNVSAGVFIAEWFNPINGIWLAPQKVFHSGGSLTLLSPFPGQDMAVRLTMSA